MKMLMLATLCGAGLLFNTGCKSCSSCSKAATACNGSCCSDHATCTKCCTDDAGCKACCKKS